MNEHKSKRQRNREASKRSTTKQSNCDRAAMWSEHLAVASISIQRHTAALANSIQSSETLEQHSILLLSLSYLALNLQTRIFERGSDGDSAIVCERVRSLVYTRHTNTHDPVLNRFHWTQRGATILARRAATPTTNAAHGDDDEQHDSKQCGCLGQVAMTTSSNLPVCAHVGARARNLKLARSLFLLEASSRAAGALWRNATCTSCCCCLKSAILDDPRALRALAE